ncbi:AAA family ATPase [Rhizobium ruizarguesonis]|uniref:AAA family ATPase n=1 Tax=Rhizobium ruizarguesonis TaxID=2081791 RepID=UPI003723066B
MNNAHPVIFSGIPVLETTSAASFAAKPLPCREFLDSTSLMPCRNVVLMSGDGGTGKSLLALQLAIAVVVTGTDWLGIAVRSGPVVYISAEEDQQETHIRLAEICAADGIDLSAATDLHICFMAGEDAVLAFESGKGAKLQTTKLFKRLIATLELRRPLLLVLDNLADIFSGNENSRSLAKQFIGLLRGLAIRFDCTVLVLAHPSLTGLNSGSGSSGSTAWSNSVRARLFLRKDIDANGWEQDKDRRLLETMKANYAPRGQPVGLKWCEGRFVRSDPPKPFDDVTVANLESVQQIFRTGKYRADERAAEWGGYVVASILGLDIGCGIGADERTSEQKQARKKVRKILATWIRNEAIATELRPDQNRKEKFFFTVPAQESEELLTGAKTRLTGA